MNCRSQAGRREAPNRKGEPKAGIDPHSTQGDHRRRIDTGM